MASFKDFQSDYDALECPFKSPTILPSDRRAKPFPPVAYPEHRLSVCLLLKPPQPLSKGSGVIYDPA